MDWISPRRVIDVGCGTGAWLSVFAEHGVEVIRGIDGPWLDPDLLCIPPSRFTTADLRHPLHLDADYDLVVSLEVAEHLPAARAASFVEMLTGLGPVVLFSAAVPGQEGTDHQNEQWPAYWANLFHRHDYLAVDCLRPRIWQDQRVAWWYAQNAVLYVARDQLDAYSDLQRIPSPDRPLPLIHPSKADRLHEQIARLEQQVARQQKETRALHERLDELSAWGTELEKKVDTLQSLKPGTVPLQRVLRALPGLIRNALKNRLR
jgi:SAM-dependent methyltransferase